MAREEDYEDLEELDRGDVFIPDDEDIEDDDIEDDEEESDEDLEDSEEEDLDDEEDEEDEDDEDEEESEDNDEESEEEDDGDEEEARIPRSRLNQVIQQREAEREKNEWLQEQLEKLLELQKTSGKQEVKEEPDTPQYDFEAKEAEYIELVIEGETDKAAKLRLEIDNARNQATLREIEAAKQIAREEALKKAESSRDEEKLEQVIVESQAKYSFLDDSSDDFNPEAVEAINAQMTGLVAMGEKRSVALKKAVENLAPLFNNLNPKKEKEVLGKKRTKAARKKAAKASRQQPPVTKRAAKGKAARNLDHLDILKMSDAEYNKLSLRERKALRGD